MSEDEKLVERVALDVRHARHAGTPEGLRRPSSLDRHISRAAIAAVRAYDAEQGLVTVPNATLVQLEATMDEIIDKGRRTNAVMSEICQKLGLATPAPQSDGEAG